MKSIIIISILVFPFFLSQKPPKPIFPGGEAEIMRPTPHPGVDVRKINLEKETVYEWCSAAKEEYADDSCSIKDNEKTTISIIAAETKEPGLIYHYTVTGGTVTGQGPFVAWYFAGTRPGTYSVTVQIENNHGIFGEPLTKNITFRECACCLQAPPPCNCPQITIESSGEKVRRNEEVLFETKLSGGSQTSADYHWAVEGGEIISGQGTSKIKVKAANLPEPHLGVNVDVWGLCASCPTTANKSLKITE